MKNPIILLIMCFLSYTNGFQSGSWPKSRISNLQPIQRLTNSNTNIYPKRTESISLVQLNMISTSAKSKRVTHHEDGNVFKPRRPLGRFVTEIFRRLFWILGWWIVKWRNKTFVHDPNNNLRYFYNNNGEKGILTFSNHISIFDDPGIWIGIFNFKTLTLKFLRSIVMEESWYWSLGKLSAGIFRGLNCIPIKRGDIRALECPALRELYGRLNGLDHQVNGDRREHVHIMIEGRINQHWRYHFGMPRLGKFRKGTAKLIACSPPKKTLVIPIFHTGLDQVFPEEIPVGIEFNDRLTGTTKSFWPKKHKRIDIYIGDPVDFTDILPESGYSFDEKTDKNLLDTINLKLYESMIKLDQAAKHQERHLHLRNDSRAP